MDSSAQKNLVSAYMCKLTGTKSLDDSIDVFETGLVNSLAAIQVISFIEKNFKVKVTVDDLNKANFCSIQAICGFVNSKATANA